MASENSRIECLVIPESKKQKTRVECEKSLPDFCEDVSRVVKTDCCARVTDRTVTPDAQGVSVRLEGECRFSVLYVSGSKNDDSKLCTCSFSKEFSQKIDFPLDFAFDESGLWADVELRCEDAVCRPLGPRKLQLRTELVSCVGIKLNAVYEKSELSEAGLELKKECLDRAVLSSCCEKEFNASVETELPENLADVGVVNSCEVSLFALEPTLTGGALDFRALALFTCTYLPEDDTLAPVSVTQPLETSCSIENSLFNGDGIPLISLSVSDVRAEPEENLSGESRKLALGVSFLASAAQLETGSAQYVCDCYSTDYEVEVKRSRISYSSVVGAFRADQNMKFNFECPDLVSFEAPSASFQVTDCALEGRSVRAKGVFRLRGLGIPNSLQAKLFEFERECEAVLKWDTAPDKKDVPENLNIELNAGVEDIDLSVEGSELVCEAKISADVLIFSGKTDSYVTAAEKTLPRTKTKDRVVFYAPDADEDLWSIGKKFGLAQESLENQQALSAKSRFLRFTV
ncbi:MAG: DUF3794 domain-containing protein [Clostridia bacterium]|nr:DUF3794 domain-containing protein [Clostridia bacterium]